MYTVDEVMNDAVHLIPAHATVRQAANEMSRLNIGMLMVLADGKIAGMITERDLARRIVADGLSPEQTRIDEIMAEEVICIQSGANIHEACNLMRESRIRYLPVVNREAEPLGILGMTDIIAFFANSAEISTLFDGE